MNKLFIVLIILTSVSIFGYLFRVISLAQTGQILLAFGIMDILIGLAAWRGWKILRGDIAENAPLNKHDAGEKAHNEIGPGAGRPTDRFAVEMASFGIATAIVGLALIWLTSLPS